MVKSLIIKDGAMAKRRKKKQLNKFIRQLKPANFFLQRGHVRWGRVILVILLVLVLAAFGSDLQRRASVAQETTATDKLPFNQLTKQQFIDRIAPEAVKLQNTYHVRASITLAQAALESNWGQSKLAYKYNNFFGVKAAAGQPAVTMETSEFVNGQWITVNGKFRVYDTWQDSLVAHNRLLAFGTTDNPNRYAAVINGATYEAAAEGLYDGGYATDPDYPAKIIHIIKTYQLDQYDTK